MCPRLCTVTQIVRHRVTEIALRAKADLDAILRRPGSRPDAVTRCRDGALGSGQQGVLHLEIA